MTAVPSVAGELPGLTGDGRNRVWTYAGGDSLGVNGRFAVEPLPPARPDEVVARVDAISICSSDVKVIRLGADHPLLAGRDLAASPVVLGHEIALTVVDVGEQWKNRYRPGQRLGVQPAIVDGDRRFSIGFDLPGGMAQYMRLDATVLGERPQPYVFEVPDNASAATVAMLEPYGCVVAAFRKNSRTGPKPGGRVLIVGGEGLGGHTMEADVGVAETILVNAPAGLRRWAELHAASITEHARTDVATGAFDDIVVCGNVPAAEISSLFSRLDRGGLLVLVAEHPPGETVSIDIARIHYHGIGVVGARGPRVDDAFGDEGNRFELRKDGAALILGAGGAMGRIQLHRALEMQDGPALVLATSRKGERLERLRSDFAPLAKRHDKELVVVDDSEADDAVHRHTAGGVDDAVVVAPDVHAVERAASLVGSGGLVVAFAGTPFGNACHLPLWRVATDGLRITGSTGCTVDDQLDLLGRVVKGELDLARNLEAIVGFGAVPEALRAVMEGRVHGKIVIYPQAIDLPLTPLSQVKRSSASAEGWTRTDEIALGVE